MLVIEYCNYKNDTKNIIIGSIIITAIVLTYLPQYLKICKDKSTKGISYLYLLLGNISNFTNFFGSLLLNYKLIDCCTHVNASHCLNILLPIYQMFTPWLCIFILYTIFLIYDNAENIRDYNLAFINYTLFIIVFVVLIGFVGLGLIIHYQKLKNNIDNFGNFLNIISTITCFFTYVPNSKNI